MATPEGATLRAVQQYLKLCRIAHWRINTMGVPIPSQPGKFRPAPGRGISDIIGIGRFEDVGGDVPIPLAIEVKSKRGEQSRAQFDFQEEWRAAGGVYLLVRSVDELRRGLADAGLRVP